jgi:FkbM family methyltransferase
MVQMKIGRRRLYVFWRRLKDRNNYKAVREFLKVHQRPLRILFEEVFSLGTYPRTVTIKTPTGPVSVQLFSAADMSTLNLVFCRHDYYLPQNTRVVVDIGSNIGLTTLYWLTRNTESFVYCYEPAPVSYDRLMHNLRAFSGRFLARRAAVSDFNGSATLGMEPTGVDSSLELKSNHSVTCQVVHINEVLETALDQHGHIDVLKVDSEGHEQRTFQAIAPEYWKFIRCVNVGCRGASGPIPPEFKHDDVGSAERFWR